ncbi:hypothetical protein H8959_004404 [Pygathrix nigripes]
MVSEEVPRRGAHSGAGSAGDSLGLGLARNAGGGFGLRDTRSRLGISVPRSPPSFPPRLAEGLGARGRPGAPRAARMRDTPVTTRARPGARCPPGRPLSLGRVAELPRGLEGLSLLRVAAPHTALVVIRLHSHSCPRPTSGFDRVEPDPAFLAPRCPRPARHLGVSTTSSQSPHRRAYW